MTTDNDIEAEIKAKGLTAPRVTPQSIEAKIRGEYYFTGAEAAWGAFMIAQNDAEVKAIEDGTPLAYLTFCVLILENGFTVVGTSGVASPENFNAEIGRKVARAKAVDQIWPLEGYLLRDQLAGFSEAIRMDGAA